MAVTLSAKEQGAGGWSGNVEIDLSKTGLDLKKLLSSLVKLPVESIKILCSGKFLKNETSLAEQGVKANAKLLVLKATSETQKQEIQKEEKKQDVMAKTLEVADALASREDGGNDRYEQYYFELQNQNGEKVNLPPKDRKALVMGMALHERARKSLQRGELKQACELLLQADTSFNNCDPKFISAIDNWAFVHLDLCWVYFRLKDMNYLKDAVWRIQKAKAFLEKAYGKDLSRLKTLKGETSPELVVLVRLDLLQAILAYHTGDVAGANLFLAEADAKVRDLHIDDSELVLLVSMGFATRESRTALRAAKRNTDVAVAHLLKKREDRRAAKEAEEKRLAQRKEKFKYGKTANGQLVNAEMVKAIVALGFMEDLVAEGLRQTNNDQTATVMLLTQTPELLTTNIPPPPPRAHHRVPLPPAPAPAAPLDPKMVEQVCAMGFSDAQANFALRRTATVAAAIDYLLSHPNEKVSPATTDVPMTESAELPKEEEEEEEENEEEEVKPVDPAVLKAEEERRLKQQIEDELLDAVPEDDEAYFDVDVNEIVGIIQEYRTLLSTSK